MKVSRQRLSLIFDDTYRLLQSVVFLCNHRCRRLEQLRELCDNRRQNYNNNREQADTVLFVRNQNLFPQLFFEMFALQGLTNSNAYMWQVKAII